MKFAIKRILITTLSAASILSVSSSAFAYDNTTTAPPDTSNSISPTFPLESQNGIGGGIITPFSTDAQIVNRPVSGTDEEIVFNIKPHYGYVRFYLKNTGTTTIYVSINQGSASGTLKHSGSVQPGEVFNEILNKNAAWSTGDFYVSLTSGSGPMNGLLGVRTSTDLNF